MRSRVGPRTVRSNHARSASSSSLFKTASTSSEPLDLSDICYPSLQSPHPTFILSLSSLAEVPPSVSEDELYDAILERLDRSVGHAEAGSYTLVVLAGRSVGRRPMPGLAWWLLRWRSLAKKYRKGLKQFYLIHPSRFTRTLFNLILPFLSPKAYAKFHPLPSVLSLFHNHQISLSGIKLSLADLHEEARVLRGHPSLLADLTFAQSKAETSTWGLTTLTSTISVASSYLPIPRFGAVQAPAAIPCQGLGYWGRPIDVLVDETAGRVPRLVSELSGIIFAECTRTEGVFRRTSNSYLLSPLVALLDIPQSCQPILPWTQIAKEDALLPPKLLLRFLSQLASPNIPSSLYPRIRETTSLDLLQSKLIPFLSPSQHLLLDHVMHLLHHISQHESTTRMSTLALAIVLAPSLIRGPDPLEDAALCLEQGKTLPPGMLRNSGRTVGSGDGGTVVGVLELWIRLWPAVREMREAVCGCSGPPDGDLDLRYQYG